jgi:hypothetical protein
VPLCVLESNWDTNCGAVASCFFFLLFEFWSVLLCLGPQHVCQMCLFADIRACQPSQLYHPERGASIFKSTNEPGFFCCRRLALGSASPSSCPMWLVWSALGRKLRYGLPYGRRSRLPHKWVVRLRLSPQSLLVSFITNKTGVIVYGSVGLWITRRRACLLVPAGRTWLGGKFGPCGLCIMCLLQNKCKYSLVCGVNLARKRFRALARDAHSVYVPAKAVQRSFI